MPLQLTPKQPPYYTTSEDTSQITTEITHANILAWTTTELTLVPAPGDGKIIIPTSAQIWWTNYVADYTNINAAAVLVLYTSETKLQQPNQAVSTGVANILAPGFASIAYLFPQANVSGGLLYPISGNPLADETNKPLKMYLENSAGPLTGGNAANTLKINVNYYIVTL